MHAVHFCTTDFKSHNCCFCRHDCVHIASNTFSRCLMETVDTVPVPVETLNWLDFYWCCLSKTLEFCMLITSTELEKNYVYFGFVELDWFLTLFDFRRLLTESLMLFFPFLLFLLFCLICFSWLVITCIIKVSFGMLFMCELALLTLFFLSVIVIFLLHESKHCILSNVF